MKQTKRKSLLGSCRRLVVKVGSAVLTHDRGLDYVSLHRLSDQLAELMAAPCEIVLVSSGAVAAGVRRLGHTTRPKTIPEKQAAAAVGQGVLMQAWEEGFRKHERTVSQLLLTSDDLNDRQRYLNARHTLETLLEWGVVPVINENDTVVVDEIKFGDNDQLAALIAVMLGADLLVILTDIEGLYSNDPRIDPDAKLIADVHAVDESLLAMAQGSQSGVGTGGMRSKVLAAQKCVSSGVPMVIAPGRQRDVLLRLFEGDEVGTMFWPGEKSHQGKRLWLAHLPRPAGDLVVDQGAVRALQRDGCSLLPIGIVSVSGNFGAGEPVRCLSATGEMIGVGLSNYSALEIEKIKGQHSEEIVGLLGYRHSDAVVHRDSFVLADYAETEEEKAGCR